MKLVVRLTILLAACIGMMCGSAHAASADPVCDVLAKAQIVCTPCPTPNRIGPICYG